MKKEDPADIINRFNEAIAPIENEFMSCVEKYRELGFGRMIQIITKKWDFELRAWKKKREKEEIDKWK